MKKEMFQGFLNLLKENDILSLSEASVNWVGPKIDISHNTKGEMSYEWDDTEKAFSAQLAGGEA